MTKSQSHQDQGDALVEDALNPKIDREEILGRLTALNRVSGGDARHALTQRVYNALERRVA
jgi:hypothetical protein